MEFSPIWVVSRLDLERSPVSDFLLAMGGVALLGGFGSVVRFAFSRWQTSLPWGILFANTIASVIVGACVSLSIAGGDTGSALTATILATGFAGGLSTFSSWAAQTVSLMTSGQRRRGYLNALLNMVLPVSGAIAGLILGAILLK